MLNGTNSVKSPEFDNAIHSENANADINISGNGSLTLECDNSGIFARGVLTIKSGSLIASGTGTGSSGVTAHKGIVVKGGNVEVSGTGAGMTSYDGEIKIEGGTVTAAGVGNSAEDGICAGKGVTISGGTVVASSANNGVSSDEGTITIEGGSLTASGADGIWADKGNVVIAGGNVTSTGTDGVAFYGKEIVIGKDIVSVSGSGTNGVFGSNYDEGRKVYSDPIVKIAAAGVGWTDTAGTQGRAYIPANAGEGHKLPYKKVQFYATPSPAHTPAATRVPMANTLTYTGFAQELVTAGVAERGTFYYALGTDAAIAPAFGWRASIPTGTNAGTYYVWYKVVAGDGSLVTGPQVIVVTIRGAGGSVPTSYGWSSRSHSSNTSSTTSTPAVRRLGMYRLYNPMAGEHLYTANVSEKDSLVAGGWTNEGAAFYVPSTSNTPVWRVFNPATGEHHLTTSKDERDQLTRGGWTDEGVGFYADDAKGKAMHRLFDPKANPVASHHFTSSDEERQDLIAAGWIDEGVGFYVLSSRIGTDAFFRTAPVR